MFQAGQGQAFDQLDPDNLLREIRKQVDEHGMYIHESRRLCLRLRTALHLDSEGSAIVGGAHTNQPLAEPAMRATLLEAETAGRYSQLKTKLDSLTFALEGLATSEDLIKLKDDVAAHLPKLQNTVETSVREQMLSQLQESFGQVESWKVSATNEASHAFTRLEKTWEADREASRHKLEELTRTLDEIKRAAATREEWRGSLEPLIEQAKGEVDEIRPIVAAVGDEKNKALHQLGQNQASLNHAADRVREMKKEVYRVANKVSEQGDTMRTQGDTIHSHKRKLNTLEKELFKRLELLEQKAAPLYDRAKASEDSAREIEAHLNSAVSDCTAQWKQALSDVDTKTKKLTLSVEDVLNRADADEVTCKRIQTQLSTTKTTLERVTLQVQSVTVEAQRVQSEITNKLVKMESAWDDAVKVAREDARAAASETKATIATTFDDLLSTASALTNRAEVMEKGLTGTLAKLDIDQQQSHAESVQRLSHLESRLESQKQRTVQVLQSYFVRRLDTALLRLRNANERDRMLGATASAEQDAGVWREEATAIAIVGSPSHAATNKHRLSAREASERTWREEEELRELRVAMLNETATLDGVLHRIVDWMSHVDASREASQRSHEGIAAKIADLRAQVDTLKPKVLREEVLFQLRLVGAELIALAMLPRRAFTVAAKAETRANGDVVEVVGGDSADPIERMASAAQRLVQLLKQEADFEKIRMAISTQLAGRGGGKGGSTGDGDGKAHSGSDTAEVLAEMADRFINELDVVIARGRGGVAGFATTSKRGDAGPTTSSDGETESGMSISFRRKLNKAVSVAIRLIVSSFDTASASLPESTGGTAGRATFDVVDPGVHSQDSAIVTTKLQCVGCDRRVPDATNPEREIQMQHLTSLKATQPSVPAYTFSKSLRSLGGIDRGSPSRWERGLEDGTDREGPRAVTPSTKRLVYRGGFLIPSQAQSHYQPPTSRYAH